MIAVGAEVRSAPAWKADAVVIGSGAGGAVAAALLAEAGLEVLVLEEGGHFQAKDFTQREGEMYNALYRLGGSQFSEGEGVNVLQGSCVGGSTVINQGDCTRIPPEVLAHWRRLTGAEGLVEADFEAAYERVEADLLVNPIPDAMVNRNNRLLLEGARKLGLGGGAFRHNRVGCVGSGYCMIGCAYDAKKGAHLNYIPRASAAGARVQADCRAERIVKRSGGGWRVEGAVVDRATRRPRLAFTAEAPVLIVAAGSIHSPALLLRSGLGGPLVGKNLSLQPQAPLIAIIPDEVIAYQGVPQSAFVDRFDEATEEAGLGGFRMEGIVGGPAMSASLIGGFGASHKERMTAFRRVAACLVLVPDRPSGEVTVDRKGRVKIAYAPTEEWKGRLRQGLVKAAEIYLAAGAEGVSAPSELAEPLRKGEDPRRIADAEITPGVFHLISAHPQGTCRLGADPRASVVDSRLEVHGEKGLFVMDGSVFPTTASTHTMIPIMAAVDLAARRLLERRASYWKA